MYVKIQLIRDNGSIVTESVLNAFHEGGWETGLGDGPVVEGDGKLYGFTYLPVPPPRDPADIAEFRRMVAEKFGQSP